MKKDKAIKLAIAAMRKQIQTVAVDANLHKNYDCQTATATNAYNLKQDLLIAIQILQSLQSFHSKPIHKQNPLFPE